MFWIFCLFGGEFIFWFWFWFFAVWKVWVFFFAVDVEGGDTYS